MHILDIFFPKRCVGCKRVGRYICSACAGGIKHIDQPICPVCEKPAIDGATHPRCKGKYTVDGLTSFFRYDGVVKKAIKAIKYRFVSDISSECISLIPEEMFAELRVLNPTPSYMIPIPLHTARFNERGFNQAEVLGIYIASRLQIPIRADILRRIRKTIPQVAMKDRIERLKNMEQVFGVSDFRQDLSKHSVILFDDVFTTGATMRQAANALKRKGVAHVWAVTIVR
jgi:competence protein ComFC